MVRIKINRFATSTVAFIVAFSVPALAQTPDLSAAIDPTSGFAPVLTFFEFQLPIAFDKFTGNQQAVADDSTNFLIERELEMSSLADKLASDQIGVDDFQSDNSGLVSDVANIEGDIEQADSVSPDAVDDQAMAQIQGSVDSMVRGEEAGGIDVGAVSPDGVETDVSTGQDVSNAVSEAPGEQGMVVSEAAIGGISPDSGGASDASGAPGGGDIGGGAGGE